MKPAKLADYLNDQNDSVLLAWDAPLTRPRDPDKPVVNEKDLTIRTIEKFFRRGGLLKPPEGNTTLGYGSCPNADLPKRRTMNVRRPGFLPRLRMPLNQRSLQEVAVCLEFGGFDNVVLGF
jgi:hypothetical protein